jgi:hypothetical protein
MTEIGHMRGLLAEMGGLSAQAPAPRAQEGDENGSLVNLLLAGQRTWNETLGWTGPNYVRTKCVELLSVGSGVLPDALRDALLRVERVLDEADGIQREGVSPSEEASHKRRASESRWKVYEEFKKALSEVKQTVKSFGVRDGLAWDQTRAELRRKTQKELKSNAYAVALSEFLTAMHMYLARYIEAASMQWDSPSPEAEGAGAV